MTARAIRAQTHHFHGVEPGLGVVEEGDLRLGVVEGDTGPGVDGGTARFTTTKFQTEVSVIVDVDGLAPGFIVNVLPSALNDAFTTDPLSTPVVLVIE